MLNSIFSCFRYSALKAYWGHEFVVSGSRDVIGHVTIWFVSSKPGKTVRP